MNMWHSIFNKKKKKEDGAREQIPLVLPLPPPIYEKNDENKEKPYNDPVIDVYKELEIDFDIDKDTSRLYSL